jgi:putative endonuclease
MKTKKAANLPAHLSCYSFYMTYVYVLRSINDQNLYIGSTTDLKRRLREHQTGKSFSTILRRPFELIYYEAYKNEEDARNRESMLKLRGNSRRFLLERISRSLQ